MHRMHEHIVWIFRIVSGVAGSSPNGSPSWMQNRRTSPAVGPKLVSLIFETRGVSLRFVDQPVKSPSRHLVVSPEPLMCISLRTSKSGCGKLADSSRDSPVMAVGRNGF